MSGTTRASITQNFNTSISTVNQVTQFTVGLYQSSYPLNVYYPFSVYVPESTTVS